jgi:hypothetical protein
VSPRSLSSFLRAIWPNARSVTDADLRAVVAEAEADRECDPQDLAWLRSDPVCQGGTVTYKRLIERGWPGLDRMGSLINLACLTYAARERFVVHAVRPGIVHLVAATDLHSLPHQAPALLQGPWVIEHHHAERGEVLWGDTIGLCGYPLGDGSIYLVGLQTPDGARGMRWAPRWEGGELAEGIPPGDGPGVALLADVQRGPWAAWAPEAVRFVLVFALLLEAERSPCGVRDEGERPRRGRGGVTGAGPQGEWIVRHVRVEQPTVEGASGLAGHAPEAPPAGRELADVRVRGHLKRQRYGAGFTQTKWIYVEGYAARRWVAPGPVRVVVGR